MQRRRICPPLKLTFDQAHQVMSSQAQSQTPPLRTTGGVPFVATARVARDGRRFISLPHQNRIYEDDWGYQTNAMGATGQRVGHYARPIDEWASSMILSSQELRQLRQ